MVDRYKPQLEADPSTEQPNVWRRAGQFALRILEAAGRHPFGLPPLALGGRYLPDRNVEPTFDPEVPVDAIASTPETLAPELPDNQESELG